MFIYDWSTDTVYGPATVSGTPPAQIAPSGTLAFLEAGMGQVLDLNLDLVRSLTLQAPNNHASLGRLANGHDTWNGLVYDDGNDDAKSNVGVLVTWDLADGSGGAVIGPKTGFPYPPDGHVSAMAYKRATGSAAARSTPTSSSCRATSRSGRRQRTRRLASGRGRNAPRGFLPRGAHQGAAS